MSVAGDTKGKTLPARAYTSPEVYEAEMREVFLKSWNFACHVSDGAEPGRFWTTTIAGEPIAVLRAQGQEELAETMHRCNFAKPTSK